MAYPLRYVTRAIITGLIVLMALAPAWAQKNSKDFRSVINESRALIGIKEYAQALDLIARAQQLAQNENENATALLYKGLALIGLGQKYEREARKAFREVWKKGGAVELPMKSSLQMLKVFEEEQAAAPKAGAAVSQPSEAGKPDSATGGPKNLGPELEQVRTSYESKKYQEALNHLALARKVARHDEQLRAVRLYEGMLLFDLGQEQREEALDTIQQALLLSLKAPPVVVIPGKNRELLNAFQKMREEVQAEVNRRAALPKDQKARWKAVASMVTAREHHTATLLSTGKVLVAGGVNSEGSLATAELYDPATDTWTPTDGMSTRRYRHTASLLPSGKVLVLGGENDDEGVLSIAELYDPATGTWAPAGSLSTGRRYHTATVLSSGKVLVAGGDDASNGTVTSAEVYDSATGAWTTTGAMASNRSSHAAILLPSGKVLVIGGDDAGRALTSSELYDPAMGTWSSSGDMPTGSYNHQASLLRSGKVMVTGGYDGETALTRVALFDPAEGKWSGVTSTADTSTGRVAHTATVLASGRVLIAGGEGASASIGGIAEVYEPAKGAWLLTASMSQERIGHTATLLPSGQVLIVGGSNEDTPLNSAELYVP